MRFSILVPVYNVEKYLDQCVSSILAQTYNDFELILVDDGSTDNSGNICDSYKTDKRVKVIHKENKGLISARRVGVQYASGDYAIFCDSDDFLEMNALELIAGAAKKSNADIIIFNAYIYKEKYKTLFYEHIFQSNSFVNKEELYNIFLSTYKVNSMWCKATKLTCIDVFKNYSYFYHCNYGEDFLQTAPIFKMSKSIYYLDEAIYNYRYSSGMMRRFNKNYYYSYKEVNAEVKTILKDQNIQNIEVMFALHLLKAAYGHMMQYKYVKKIDQQDFSNLSNDDSFKDAYNKAFKLCKKNLNRKERGVLFLLRHHKFFLYNMMIQILHLKYL